MKKFLYQYRNYDFYQITDAVNSSFYTAEKEDPTKGITITAESLDKLIEKVDEFYQSIGYKFLFGEKHRNHK